MRSVGPAASRSTRSRVTGSAHAPGRDPGARPVPDALVADRPARAGGVDHLAVTHVETDVAGVAALAGAPVEDEVAGLEVLDRDVVALRPLGPAVVGEVDAGGLPGPPG